MKIKNIQALEKILNLRHPKTKLVIKYNEKLLTANFSTIETIKPTKKDFYDEVSFANDAVKEFGLSDIYIPEGLISAKTLSEVINFVSNFDSNKVGYFPALFNVEFLESNIKLPFMLLDEDSKIEVISVLQGED